MTKQSNQSPDCKPMNTLQVQQAPDESTADATARAILDPNLRHALAVKAFSEPALGSEEKGVGLFQHLQHLQNDCDKTDSGDLSVCSRLLTAQAITLDSMFSEMARRAALNMGEYMDASERYSRLALKAQANCRATLEALAKLHQPREQTVRHVHVNEGGQAIVTDQFHNHQGGSGNGKSVKQSHATGTTDASAALPSPDPKWQGVPITGGERQEAMQNARRDKPRPA